MARDFKLEQSRDLLAVETGIKMQDVTQILFLITLTLVMVATVDVVLI